MVGRLIQITPSAYQYPLIFKQLWHTPRVQAPDQEVVYRDLKRFTYLQIKERIGRLASALAKAGVEPGDTVGVLDWDSNRFLEAFFAIPMMGAVMQTVNVRLSPEQIAYTIDHAGASTLLVNDEFVGLLEGMKAQLPKVKRLIVMSDRPSPQTGSLSFIGEYEKLLAAALPDYDFPDFDENTQATTFYTTGTTGLPKGVYYSHRQLVLHSICGLALFGMAGTQGRFSRDDVYMPITPMFHVHAWGFPWSATLAGVKQVYPGRYEPAMLVKLIKSEGVTFTHGVPTILQMLLDAAAKADVDLDGLKMVIGGSALPKALAKRAMAAGIDIFAGYGMSETGPLAAVSHVRSKDLTGDPDGEVEFRARAGIAGPLVDLRIVDPDMKSVPHDGKSAGEIVIRAPWLTQGYFNNPEGSEQLWAGGYLHTSDIAVVDANGSLHITDRIKDVIKTGGEWLLAADRGLDLAMRRRGGSRRDRRQGREMGRAAAGAGGQAALGCERPRRGRHQGSSQGVRRQGHHLEIRHSREDPLHRQHSQDQRRQDQQEGAARTIRRQLTVRTLPAKAPGRKRWATSPLPD
jgi:fatty-acyl-CoA synthase